MDDETEWHYETLDVPPGVTEVQPEITVWSHDVGGFRSYYDFSAGEWITEAVTGTT